MPNISRKTKQKAMLENGLGKMAELFSTEELFVYARKADPKIGIATVYRFLKSRTSQGIAHKYSCGKKTVYSTSTKGHGHFTCQKCGRTAHLNITDLGFLSRAVKGKVCHFQLDVFGLCEKCAQK